MLATRIEDFLHYLHFEKRYSSHTSEAYKKDLDQFKDFIYELFEIEDLNALQLFHFRTWLASLKDKKQAARTINRKISTLKSFYKFLMRQGFAQQNPISLLHAQKLPERLPVFLKKSETKNLLEEIQFDPNFKGYTDRLICEILYQTGIRRQELIGLKESDVEWSLKQIRVLGKGQKERLIPIHPLLLNSINDYLDLKKTMNIGHQDFLLTLENGKKLYPEYVYRIVKKYLFLVTSQKKKSPHVMRHSFATHLLNNGANIQAIKDLLGHSSLAATQVYTSNNIEKLKEIHQKNHPRG